MRKIILLLVLALIINLTILSTTHGQSSVSIGGVVPVTDLNRNSTKQQININKENPQPAENKYLYFFEKTLGLQKESEAQITGNILPPEAQSVYDQVFSSLLLWILMLLVAIIIFIILKLVDKFIIQKIKSFKRRTRRHHYA